MQPISPASAAIHTLIETISLLDRRGELENRWTVQILELLTAALSAEAALLLLPGEGCWERLAVRTLPAEPSPPAGRTRGMAAPWFDRRFLNGPPTGLMARVLAGETNLDAADGEPSPWDSVKEVTPGRMLGARLTLEGDAAGALAVWNARAPHAPLILAAAGAALSAALRNLGLVRRLEAEAVTDDLTGVYNYRFLRQALIREVKRASRHDYPLGILMLDVDNLKEYNARFGHLQGSQVLKQMASVLRSGMRDTDLVAKYGGDEFLIILPHSTREGSAVVAERMRREVAAAAFPHVAAGEITCSIGIAVYPEDATEPMALVAAADRVLFIAKRQGKNRIAA